MRADRPRCAAPGEVKDRLRQLNGTAQELLDNDELMQLMLPVRRADFAALETHEHRDEPPLDLPLRVFGGAFDHTVRPPELDAGGCTRRSPAACTCARATTPTFTPWPPS